jgi:hypothetical protein
MAADKGIFELKQSRQQFPLGETQRHFLYTGDKRGYSSKRFAEKKIGSKLDCLGGRLQDLIDDIALLHYRGLLAPEYWINGREQLMNIDPRRELRDEDVTWISGFRGSSIDYPPEENHVRLGFAFGQLLRFLYTDTSPEHWYHDLAWGFILGLVGRPSEENEKEQEDIREIIAVFDERVDTRVPQYIKDRSAIRDLTHVAYEMKSGRHADRDPLTPSTGYDVVLPSLPHTIVEREDIPISRPFQIELTKLDDGLSVDETHEQTISKEGIENSRFEYLNRSLRLDC